MTKLYTEAQNYEVWQSTRQGVSVFLRREVLTKLNLTRLNTVRDRSVNVIRLWRFDDTRMKDALEMATSLPDPIAMPTSAAVKAGASLIPSPTIATTQRSFSLRRLKNFHKPRSGRFIPTCCSH